MRKAVLALLTSSAVLALTIARVPPARAVGPLRVTIGTSSRVGSLDPRKGDGEIAREVWKLQYPTLVALDAATFEPEPGLADTWSPSPDGRGWRYTLRAGQWSDGRPVVADDVVYSLRHARDEHWPYAGSMLDGLDARKIDDHTVDVTSAHDSARLPTLLLHVVPAHVFEQVADIESDPTAASVSGGHWQLVSHDEREVQLNAVEGPARPPIDEIVYRTYPDDAALLRAISSEEADAVSGASGGSLARLRTLDGVTATHANDGAQYVAIANLEHGATPLQNELMRRRVFAVLDREKLVQASVDGVGREQKAPRAARAESWSLDESSPDLPAGATSHGPFIPANVTLSVGGASNDPVGQRIAAEIVRQLNAAGVRAERAKATPDIAVVRHNGSDDPSPVLRELTCSGGYLCDSQYDALFEQFTRERDPATRVELGRRMLQRAFDHRLEVALLAPDTLQAFRTDRIAGWLRHPDEQRLMAFAPSVEQYNQLMPATAPPGEAPGNGVLFAGAFVLGIGFVGLYVIAVFLRHRSRRTDGNVAAA